MVIPSIADALIVIVLLIPGFIAFWITKRIGKFNRPLSEFETSIWSFVLSAIILFFFTSTTKLSDLDLIRQQFFYPANFFALFVITVIVGLVAGSIFYLTNRNRTREDSQQFALKLNRKFVDAIADKEDHLIKSHKNKEISDEEYEKKLSDLIPDKKKSILRICTKDNKEYTGFLLHSTDDNWDILIKNAYEDEKWDKLLIRGEEITKIFFNFPDSKDRN